MQGSALSPALTNILLSILSRQLNLKKGKQEVPNNLSFADDVVLITHDIATMRTLLDTVDRFCQWAGIRVNNAKSEVTSFDYRLMQEMHGTKALTIDGRPLKHLHPFSKRRKK